MLTLCEVHDRLACEVNQGEMRLEIVGMSQCYMSVPMEGVALES